MGVRFVNVLAQVALAGRRPKVLTAPQSLFGKGGRSIEEALRAREIAGDRIAACLGCILALSSLVFLLYAFKASAPSRVDLLPPASSMARQGTLIAQIESGAERDGRSDEHAGADVARAAPRALRVMPARGHAETIKPPDPPGLGYVLLRVLDGAATVKGPDGVMTVTPGMVITHAGRVQAIERHATGWVVVTSRTIISATARRESGDET